MCDKSGGRFGERDQPKGYAGIVVGPSGKVREFLMRERLLAGTGVS